MGHTRFILLLLWIQHFYIFIILIWLIFRSVRVGNIVSSIILLLLDRGRHLNTCWTHSWRLVHQIQLLLHLLNIHRVHILIHQVHLIQVLLNEIWLLVLALAQLNLILYCKILISSVLLLKLHISVFIFLIILLIMSGQSVTESLRVPGRFCIRHTIRGSWGMRQHKGIVLDHLLLIWVYSLKMLLLIWRIESCK